MSNPACGAEVLQLVRVDARLGFEVEIGQFADHGKVDLLQSSHHARVTLGVEFLATEHHQEVAHREFLPRGFVEQVEQAVADPAQAQFGEPCGQLVIPPLGDGVEFVHKAVSSTTR